MAIVADLRARKVTNTKIADILGVSPAALARAVAKHGLPKKRTKAQPFVVAQYVHHTGPRLTLEEMAATPKAQTVDAKKLEEHRRSFARELSLEVGKGLSRAEKPVVPQKTKVDFALADLASKGPRHFGYARIGEIQPNPFRLKARVCEFNRDRRAILEEVEAEIEKAFRTFRTLAGPNTRIEDPEVFARLAGDALAAYDHLQGLMAAARHLRAANGEITEAAINLHKAGAALSRPTA